MAIGAKQKVAFGHGAGAEILRVDQGTRECDHRGEEVASGAASADEGRMRGTRGPASRAAAGE
jgi:hypothetical protein